MSKYSCIEDLQFKLTVTWEDGGRVVRSREELYCPFCPSGPYKEKNCFFGEKLERVEQKRSKGAYKSDEFILKVIAQRYKDLGRPPIFSDFDSKKHGICYDTIKDRFGGLPQARKLVERGMSCQSQ